MFRYLNYWIIIIWEYYKISLIINRTKERTLFNYYRLYSKSSSSYFQIGYKVTAAIDLSGIFRFVSAAIPGSKPWHWMFQTTKSWIWEDNLKARSNRWRCSLSKLEKRGFSWKMAYQAQSCQKSPSFKRGRENEIQKLKSFAAILKNHLDTWSKSLRLERELSMSKRVAFSHCSFLFWSLKSEKNL